MIPVKNVYHMLSYAFHILREDGYKQFGEEEFWNQQDLFAAILARGMALQVKKGLARDYIAYSETTSVLRGKVEMADSLKDRTIAKQQLVCSFDEYSENSMLNRILKSTAELLTHSDDVALERKRSLRKVLVYFRQVDSIDVSYINWSGLKYNRNNQSYQMLVNLCLLVIKGLLHTDDHGDKRKLTVYLDDQAMHRLYERFLLAYFRKHHPKLHTSASHIKWSLDDSHSDMLPRMQSDITLSYENRILILDAKYYSKTMQYWERYDSRTLHSANLYQIFTYVKNQDSAGVGNVSGMLLYAKTDEEIVPNNTYRMSGNTITVRTLDLSQSFAHIQQQLDAIAIEFMGAGS